MPPQLVSGYWMIAIFSAIMRFKCAIQPMFATNGDKKLARATAGIATRSLHLFQFQNTQILKEWFELSRENASVVKGEGIRTFALSAPHVGRLRSGVTE